MNEQIKDGGSAFPVTFIDGPTGQPCAIAGMTLRDYFAATALSTMSYESQTDSTLAECAYKLADAMLAAREVQS